MSTERLRHAASWLNDLARLVAGNQPLADVKAKLAAYTGLLVSEFPEAAFTRDSLAAVAKACKFFPAYGELAQALSGWWRDNRPIALTLPKPEPPAPEPRTPGQAEIDAVAAAVRECVVTLHPPAKPEATPATAPCWLSDGALLAEYERLHAQGINQSTRIKMLRQRIADVAH